MLIDYDCFTPGKADRQCPGAEGRVKRTYSDANIFSHSRIKQLASVAEIPPLSIREHRKRVYINSDVLQADELPI